MFIADAHCDTLYALGIHHSSLSNCMITPERLEQGSVGLQTFALFAGGGGMADHPHDKAMAMLSVRDQLHVPFIEGDLTDIPAAPHGIISLEGGEILEGSLTRLHEMDELCRPRMIALTWNNENEIGFPAAGGSNDGLKPFGKSLLREMDRLGILADVSHLNEAGFWDICENASLPPIATHSNARAVCDHFRNLSDEQIKAVIEKKGFIGINFYTDFLTTEKTATTDDLLRHIDRIAQLGGIDVLGFGSDFDGINHWPTDLRHPGDFPQLIEKLLAHGYRHEDVEKIAGLNLWRVLTDAQSARAV